MLPADRLTGFSLRNGLILLLTGLWDQQHASDQASGSGRLISVNKPIPNGGWG